MTLNVVFNESAWRDFDEIYDWISAESNPGTAYDYLARVEIFCQRLSGFPRKGTPRDDLMPDLRTLVFEHKMLVAYLADDHSVRVVRILQHVRDPAKAFRA